MVPKPKPNAEAEAATVPNQKVDGQIEPGNLGVTQMLFGEAAADESLGQNISVDGKTALTEEDSLSLATSLMTAKKSQQAIAITGLLLERIGKTGQYNAPFGLKVRLVHGSALIHAEMNRESFDFLWQLKDDSKRLEDWSVFAETCRVIASVLSYSGRPQQALENLRQAQLAISTHQLDAIYPHFAVRLSSWHRNFGDRDSSLFYAEEAIRTAGPLGKVFEEAEGHLLLALNYESMQRAEAALHYKIGADLYHKIEEFTTFCGMYLGLTRLALRKEAPKEALAYIDTIFHYLPSTSGNNIDISHRAFKRKADAFQQLGQLDSAIIYLKKGYFGELDFLRAQNLEKVVEIDNKYNVEKKTQELEAKNLEIKTERERRRWSVVLTSIILFFSGVLVFNILKLRTANKLTQKQAEELKTLDAAKSRFFANISHELRTPITLMLGPVRTVLKEKQLSEKQRKLLKMAEQNGNQLRHLVNEILDLRKLEMGKMELDLAPTPIAAFFNRYAVQFESLAARNQLELSIRSNIDPAVVANIDREKCRQILHNLLSNAFKFTPAGGQIQASLFMRGDMLHMKISDTGIGIHPDELPNIFDRFFQADSPFRLAEGGTGIGLALCREYAELFGGKIEAESTFGRGTVFRVSFPVELVENARYGAITPLSENTHLPPLVARFNKQIPAGAFDGIKPTILIVEDNYHLQEYIQLILQDRYHVVTAENGQAALEIIGNKDGITDAVPDEGSNNFPPLPDLIISDLMMPGMNGFQLLDRVKTSEITRHIPVIMLTARVEQRDKLKALRIGVDDYITKPFDDEVLLVRIENLLKNQAARIRKKVDQFNLKPTTPVFSERDQKWLAKFEAYVRGHYTDSLFSVPFLADEFAMSQSTLARQIKRLTGLTTVKYLQEVKLEEARRLLQNQTFDSIAAVADKVGYKDVRSFSRVFRERFGELPSGYRKSP